MLRQQVEADLKLIDDLKKLKKVPTIVKRYPACKLIDDLIKVVNYNIMECIAYSGSKK